MDESLQDLEVELRGMTPRTLRPQLLDRVEKEVGAPLAAAHAAQKTSAKTSSGSPGWRWLGFGVIGLAATVAVLVAIPHFLKNEASRDPARVRSIAATASAPVSDDSYQPVAASNVLYEMKDEGPATGKSEGGERRVRYRYVDTYTWKNPRNNASLTWSVPRDEIRLQPAQFN